LFALSFPIPHINISTIKLLCSFLCQYFSTYVSISSYEYVKYADGRSIAQAVSGGILAPENRVRSHVSSGGICGEKMSLVQVRLGVFRFPPVNLIPPLFHIHSYTRA
jgi:hypothetical protein